MSITFIYRLLLRLLLPAIAAATLAVALRDGSFRYLQQRFGRFVGVGGIDKPVWVHCASVGETNTALALIRIWLERHPDDNFVLTTNTVTAARMLNDRFENTDDRIRHCYLPLDYPLFCRRFLDAVKPRCAWVMETEIWLNLLSGCHKNDVPVFIINGRLSQRTLDGAKLISAYYRQSLALVKKILARSKKDAVAFVSLGAEADKVELIGNLKFSSGAADSDSQRLPDLIGTRYILAASTHADEEIQIAQCWQNATQTSADNGNPPLLVIAPRHPYRGKVVEKQLNKRGFNARRRSRFQTPDKNTSIYIADTIGELPALIDHADMVFMGGSLVPVGGHNVLEPARLGTPQVVGPHTHNFHEEISTLQEANGIIRINDTQALARVFRDAIDATPAHADIAQNALALMNTYRDIAAAYVDRIESEINGV